MQVPTHSFRLCEVCEKSSRWISLALILSVSNDKPSPPAILRLQCYRSAEHKSWWCYSVDSLAEKFNPFPTNICAGAVWTLETQRFEREKKSTTFSLSRCINVHKRNCSPTSQAGRRMWCSTCWSPGAARAGSGGGWRCDWTRWTECGTGCWTAAESSAT